MRYTTTTLQASARDFEKALAGRNLAIGYQRSLNLWSQIVVGKNYSAACAQARAMGSIQAVPITAESVCHVLASANRTVDAATAVEVFSEAIAAHLERISYSLSCSLTALGDLPSSCIVTTLGDRETGLGIMDATHAGYIPVGSLRLGEDRDQETGWMRENAAFVAAVLNRLAGLSEDQAFETYAANIRVSSDRDDEVFRDFLAVAMDPLSKTIADDVVAMIGPDCDQVADVLDFDEIRNCTVDAFDALIRQAQTKWLKTDGDLADAVFDHVAGRILDAMRVYSNGKMDSKGVSELTSFIADAAWHAMRVFIRKGT